MMITPVDKTNIMQAAAIHAISWQASHRAFCAPDFVEKHTPEVFREGAHRVFAECDPRNVPSWKLLEKVGLRREAHFRQNIWFRRNENGVPVWKDTLIYAILENDMGR